jgi:dynein assembly factor 1
MAEWSGVRMTKKYLVELCQRHDGYRTPSVNDKLYLHQQGFRRLDPEVLKEFTGIKMLWLQANGLEKLEGFEHMPLLRNIAAHENCIEKIEGLEHSKELDSINLNRNFIKKVEGFEHNQNLTSINLGNNAIGPDGESYKAVAENLPKLQTLDLQANKIEDGAELLKILQKIPDLRVFYGMGNPFVKSFRHYRKRFVAGLPSLRYLDDRPVFEDERKRCEAWFAAFGENEDLEAANAAERDMIKTIKQEKRDQEERRVKAFDDMIREARAAHAAAEAAKQLEGVSFSGDPIHGVNGPLRDENADPNKPRKPFVDVEDLD